MPRGKKIDTQIDIEKYTHSGEKRKNNPLIGLVSTSTDKLNGKTKYQHDPHIDPYLSWAGKAEGQAVEVQNVSLHIHERIDPSRIIKSFIKSPSQKNAEQQTFFSLFETPGNYLPLNKAVDFYRHEQEWTKPAKALKAEVNEDALERFSGVISIPFTAGEHNKIAVKIIDNRGIESFVIKNLE